MSALNSGSLFLALSLAFAAGCGDDDLTNPTQGAIRVQTETSGSDLDPNGYAFEVDGGPATAIGLTDEVVVENLGLGNHEVALDGMADNCTTAEGENPQTIDVVGGDTVTVVFEVACTPPDGGGGGL